jgi:hypothetical protein
MTLASAFICFVVTTSAKGAKITTNIILVHLYPTPIKGNTKLKEQRHQTGLTVLTVAVTVSGAVVTVQFL